MIIQYTSHFQCINCHKVALKYNLPVLCNACGTTSLATKPPRKTTAKLKVMLENLDSAEEALLTKPVNMKCYTIANVVRDTNVSEH